MEFEKDPSRPGADVLDVHRQQLGWTNKEIEDLLSGIREFGIDWVKVQEKVSSKSYKAVVHKANRLHQMFNLDPSLPGADILHILN